MADLSEFPLRINLILSTLSGKPLKLKKIRSNDEEPGLKDYEVDLLKLIEKFTNGTRIEINETGTSLKYIPGLLIGGKIEHECKLTRGIGYYLELIICLAPFMKQPLEIVLKGITNDPNDVSIDRIKYATIPIYKRFIGSDDGLELKTIKRGAKPNGGGEVYFRSPTKAKLIPINLVDPGKIKRIRGIAYAMRVAPTICNRMVETSKGILLKFIPDVYIVTDHQKAINAGNSPAFGLTLVAETKNGTFLCGEACSQPRCSANESNIPEDIAIKATHNLLEEIYRGGCIDSSNQCLTFLHMALNQKDVSKVVSGIISPYAIDFLRAMKTHFDIMFKIEPFRINNNSIKDLPKCVNNKKEDTKEDEDVDENNDFLRLGHEKLVVSCLGIGFTNLTKTLI